MADALLTVKDISLSFGGLAALNKVSFAPGKNKIHGLIGPNGAGKTSMFNVITGLYRPDRGSVVFRGRDITRLAPHKLCALGISRTFQNIRLFSNLNVIENVLLGCHCETYSGTCDVLFNSRRHRREKKETVKKAKSVLSLVGLNAIEGQNPLKLPYGIQRRLEIARALATSPELLLLDEPSAGMNTREKGELAQLIKRLNTELEITILIIEHDMKLIMSICDQITVLDHGIKIAEGAPQAIQTNERVVEAYLGSEFRRGVGNA
ncbi:MAG: ABC transporter ATP-binding protein [Firmicutes bacterium]|nr:ABC transporter ATP-binding protein [Bacillota bacterium]